MVTMEQTGVRSAVQAEMMIWMGLTLLMMLSSGLLLRQLKRKRGMNNTNLPPGPPCVPILGSLPFLPRVNPPELLFQQLAERYGDVMLLRFGARNIVVVSSARMAMAFLKEHDHEFVNRSSHIAYQHLSWNNTALPTMSSTNPLFKPTRRMFASEIVSPRKIAAAESVRKEQVVQMVRSMVQELDTGRCVNVSKAASALAMNLALCMSFGRDYGTKAAAETDTLVRNFHKLIHLQIQSSYGNYGDFIPALRRLDLQGLDAQFRDVKAQLRSSITALIEKREEEMRAWSEEELRSSSSGNERDIVSKLLSMKGEDRFSQEQLVAVVFTILYAGTDSIYKTITEAIHEVVSHPHIHKRALQDLDAIAVTTATATATARPRLVEDADMPRLPLLRNIVKETLRLHPPAPTFPPHRSFHACQVGGYAIPADASVVINLPPIMRDASFWAAPLQFHPDRFDEEVAGAVTGPVTVQGSDFHFIPFGFGQRQCPAIQLSLTTVTYAVAVCLQCVSWRVPPQALDRHANVGTAAEPRKKADLLLLGALRVDPRLLDDDHSAT